MCLLDVWLSDPSMTKWTMIRTLARTEGWLAGFLLFVNINSWVIGALAALHFYLISRSMSYLIQIPIYTHAHLQCKAQN